MFCFEFMAREVYGKLKSTSITSSISSKPTSVENIPFPAVTITSKLDDSIKLSPIDHIFTLMTFNFQYIGLYKANLNIYTDLQGVVDQFICYDRTIIYLITTVPFNYTSNRAFFDYLKANRTQHRVWFEKRRISWNGIENASFAETFTRYGLGFSFNLMQANDLLDFDR
jgi:Amiloride-sensitive sodium channel